MVNAFTFDNGSPKSFASRKEMYDYMIENGHVIIEGDDAKLFATHCANSKSEKAKAAAAKVAEMTPWA